MYSIFERLRSFRSAAVPGLLAVVTALAVVLPAPGATAAHDPDRVKAWGYNAYGQLGNGTTTERHTPVTVAGLTGADVRAIAAGRGGFHALALLSDGTVEAWGYNGYGQLGDGTSTSHMTPGVVAGLTNVVAVAAGGNHSLALLSDGTVEAWGYNGYGQLGDGTTTTRYTPVPVPGLTGVRASAAGGNHSLAVSANGHVKAWGLNNLGQLGDGTTTNRSAPVAVMNLTGVSVIAAGLDHSLAVSATNGTVKAWGRNDLGQVGDGTTTNRSIPVQVPGLNHVRAIAGGGLHSLAVLFDGTVEAWGYNNNGQLGDGSITERNTPVSIGTGLAGITTVAAGNAFSLAA